MATSRVTAVNKFTALDQNKNYTVLNELGIGKYFGEISVMTNLPVTASVHCVSTTICAKIHKSYFKRYCSVFRKAQETVESRMHAYNDQYFKTLHRIVANVPIFKNTNKTTVRNLLFLLRQIDTMEGKVIIRFREVSQKAYFVYSGQICVNVVNQETGERTPFLILNEGACFNLYTCILGYESLFEIVAHANSRLLVMDREDLFQLSRSDMHIMDIIRTIESENIVKGVKYDFFFLHQETAETEPNSVQVSAIIDKASLKVPKTVRLTKPKHRRDNALTRTPMELSEIQSLEILVSPKTLRKIRSCRKELIERLREAETTFALIDSIFEARIQHNAVMCNNKYVNEETRRNMIHINEKLEYLNSMGAAKKANYGRKSTLSKEPTHCGANKYEGTNTNIDIFETQCLTNSEHDLLSELKSEDSDKEQKRQMNKYLNKGIAKFLKLPDTQKFDSKQLNKVTPTFTSMTPQVISAKKNNLKGRVTQDVSTSHENWPSMEKTPGNSVIDMSTINRYERTLYQTVEKYEKALQRPKLAQFNSNLKEARKAFFEIVNNTRRYTKLVDCQIKSINNDLEDFGVITPKPEKEQSQKPSIRIQDPNPLKSSLANDYHKNLVLSPKANVPNKNMKEGRLFSRRRTTAQETGVVADDQCGHFPSELGIEGDTKMADETHYKN